MKTKVLGLCLAVMAMGMLAGCTDTTLSDTVSGSIVINAPVETVFNYVTQTPGPEWNPFFKEVSDEDGKGFGATYKWTYDVVGVEMKGDGIVTDFNPNQSFTVKSSGDINSTWTLVFVPREDNTKTKLIIVIDYSLQIPEAAKMGKEALAKRTQESLEKILATVKEKVEK